MNEFSIIKAEQWHADFVASHLRQADINEIAVLGGADPYVATMKSWEHSTLAWAALIGDKPIAVFGVYPTSALTGLGCPWLLGTDDTARVKRRFLTETGPYMAEMLAIFPRLRNFVDAANTQSINWLKWLGFTVDEGFPNARGELIRGFHMHNTGDE